jgi:hypothetical protein
MSNQFVTVPVDPTEEMLEAGRDAHYKAEQDGITQINLGKEGLAYRQNRAGAVYRAMIAAAPASTAQAPAPVCNEQTECEIEWNNWWHEIENFSMRWERLSALNQDDLSKTAFEQGWQARAALSAPAQQVEAALVTPDHDGSPCRQCGATGVHLCSAHEAAQAPVKLEPWIPQLVDRADGVVGHYAIGRMNVAGYCEFWNLRSHRWASASEDVLTLEQAQELLRNLAIPTAKVELDGITQGLAEAVKEQSEHGFWRPCSGCHETEDGHPVGKYPYSEALGCSLGNGCSECGGLGATWWDLSGYSEDAARATQDQATGDDGREGAHGN